MATEQLSVEWKIGQHRNERNSRTEWKWIYNMMEAVIRGKFTGLGAYIKIWRSHASNLAAHLRAL